MKYGLCLNFTYYNITQFNNFTLDIFCDKFAVRLYCLLITSWLQRY